MQVNDTIFQLQYEADTDFTSVDSTTWDALPGIRNRVLLVQGEQVRGWAGGMCLNWGAWNRPYQEWCSCSRPAARADGGGGRWPVRGLRAS